MNDFYPSNVIDPQNSKKPAKKPRKKRLLFAIPLGIVAAATATIPMVYFLTKDKKQPEPEEKVEPKLEDGSSSKVSINKESSVVVGKESTIKLDIKDDDVLYSVSLKVNKHEIDQTKYTIKNNLITIPANVVTSNDVTLLVKTADGSTAQISFDVETKDIYEGGDGAINITTHVPKISAVSWKSDNENVATVDQNGKVTAVGTGEANIIATCGKQTASCKVTVKQKTIRISRETESIKVGGTSSVYVETDPDTSDVTWYVDDPNIVDITYEGKNCSFKGKAEGTCTLSALAFGKVASCLISVLPNTITVDESAEVRVDETVTITATTDPAEAEVHWSIDSPTEAEIIPDGKSCQIKGLVEGTCYVTAESLGKTATCVVTVLPKRESQAVTGTNNGNVDLTVRIAHDGSANTNISFSKDGKTWNQVTRTSDITLKPGETIKFKGKNHNGFNKVTGGGTMTESKIRIFSENESNAGSFALSGNAMSLIDNDGENPVPSGWTLPACCFHVAFANSSALTSISENFLADVSSYISSSSKYCFEGMFQDDTGLTTAPPLPSMVTAERCYCQMFKGCTLLQTTPVLPAENLSFMCYCSMFEGCTGLTSISSLPSTTLANACYWGMFSDCTSLTQAPVLPATKMAQTCYRAMFSGCTELTVPSNLMNVDMTSAANTNCCMEMYSGCSKLKVKKSTGTGNDFVVVGNYGYDHKYMFKDTGGEYAPEANPDEGTYEYYE